MNKTIKTIIFSSVFLLSGCAKNALEFTNFAEPNDKVEAKAPINFAELLQPVPAHAKFIDPDYFIWGGSLVKGDDGKYHLFYARWKKELGHNAWLTRSEIAHAIGETSTGPFTHQNVVLPLRDPNFWDGGTTHNPTVHKFGDKYYLYYMGTTGDGKVIKGYNWSHRNNQRIGVAVSDSPFGPWERRDEPLIDVSKDDNAFDALMVSNPSVAQRSDGKYVMVYKSVAKHRPAPAHGPVVHMVATSDYPDKGFVKHPEPIFTAKGAKFPAEDPFIWQQNGMLWAIVKDMEGVFTKQGRSLALFESPDGIEWRLSKNPLVSTLEINWQHKGVEKVLHLERPQLYLEDGKPKVLFCAADITREHSFNVHIPLKSE